MKRYTVKDILSQYTRNDVINHAKKYHQTYKEALQAFKAGAELTFENLHHERKLFYNDFFSGEMYLKDYGQQLNLFDEQRLRISYRDDLAKNQHLDRWERLRHERPSVFYFVVKATL